MEQAGCSETIIIRVQEIFTTSLIQFKSAVTDAFRHQIHEIERVSSRSTADRFEDALRSRACIEVEAWIQAYERGILEEVEAAKARLVADGDGVEEYDSSSDQDDDDDLPPPPDTPLPKGAKGLKLTEHQQNALLSVYEHQRHLTKLEKEMLASELGLPVRRVSCWFSNRRSRPHGYQPSFKKRHEPYPTSTPTPSTPSPPSASKGSMRRTALRSVSASSSSSMDSTISYESAASSLDISVNATPESKNPSPFGTPFQSYPSSDFSDDDSQHFTTDFAQDSSKATLLGQGLPSAFFNRHQRDISVIDDLPSDADLNSLPPTPTPTQTTFTLPPSPDSAILTLPSASLTTQPLSPFTLQSWFNDPSSWAPPPVLLPTPPTHIEGLLVGENNPLDQDDWLAGLGFDFGALGGEGLQSSVGLVMPMPRLELGDVTTTVYQGAGVSEDGDGDTDMGESGRE